MGQAGYPKMENFEGDQVRYVFLTLSKIWKGTNATVHSFTIFPILTFKFIYVISIYIYFTPQHYIITKGNYKYYKSVHNVLNLVLPLTSVLLLFVAA